MAYIVCVLVLLGCAVCIAENTETDQELNDLQVQQDSLSWLNKLYKNQDSAKTQNFADLLYKFSKSENGIRPKGPKDPKKQEKNRRGLDSGNTTQPQRRPGCRVLFWKSWSTC
uniref:Somatostatin/Cortistatin C-terminal domain-containing protein n=1 Tax=Anabas testudineus TaxID=64144 RepID=A0A3Q1IE95_ANATE